MGIRKNTENRLTLFRECDICGQRIITTADTPWMRQVQVQENGKKRKLTKYYCSSSCLKASYRHIGWYDGKAEERKRERDKHRDPIKRAESWKRYYAANGDKVKAHRMAYYWANHDDELASVRFYRKKRKILKKGAANET